MSWPRDSSQNPTVEGSGRLLIPVLFLWLCADRRHGLLIISPRHVVPLFPMTGEFRPIGQTSFLALRRVDLLVRLLALRSRGRRLNSHVLAVRAERPHFLRRENCSVDVSCRFDNHAGATPTRPRSDFLRATTSYYDLFNNF